MMPRKGPALAVVMLAVMGCTPFTGGPAEAQPAPAFSTTETISRTHLDDGVDRTVDSRTFHVTVSDTQNLRDRQGINVSWTGAHPTGGTVTDQNSAAAAQQEYPVVLMQCRGVDSASAPANGQVTPETCWTQTPAERFQYSPSGFVYPAYRMDRYATTPDRASVVNQPSPFPPDCPTTIPVAHWIPFNAQDGTVYNGGLLGCAGLPPEAANSADSLQPGNTTYGVANKSGDGTAKFVVQTTETNASLGCSKTVTCTLEIIPIMGISCDPAGVAGGPDLGLPPANRPEPDLVPTVAAQCEKTGHFAPEQVNGGGEVPDLAVSGAMWWAQSNWRNRVSVPLTFAQSATACDIVSNQSSVYLYGSESMLQATQQWAPKFCLDKNLFTLRHVQTSEPQAKNLLAIHNVEAALQGVPPATPFPEPVVQAPAAISGWGIAFAVDGNDGEAIQSLRLNARLIAKLLSESYRSCATCLDFTSRQARYNGFAALAENPTDISRDPEFQALNPGLPLSGYQEAASTLEVMSSDSDVMTSLTSYINADPEARAWLDGAPDPWGMLVNPAYKKIALPVSNWPLLDTNLPQPLIDSGANQCLSTNPVPWLPLIASPVSNPALIALHMQFDISNSQVVCKDNGAQNQKLVGVGREAGGQRYLFGLVSIADATRYQLDTALLQTQRTGLGNDVFSSPTGRTFVGATTDGLTAAAKLLQPDDTIGSWTMPYESFSGAKAGLNAYPGTMLMSIDVPTQGLPKLDAKQYAQLLRFVAGPGQASGLVAGQLAPGYLPLTTANGTGRFAAYSARAAESVAAQCGIVPLVSGAATTGTGSCSSGTSAEPPPPPVDTGGAEPTPSKSPSSSPSPSPSPSSSAPSPVQAVPVAKTVGIRPGAIGVALPVAVLVALVALCGVAYNNGVGRRR